MPNVHPYIVHFPIALFITAVVSELIAYFLKSKIFSSAALVTSVGASLAAIAAVITGLLAEKLVPRMGDARKVFESHETLGFLVLAAAITFTALKLFAYFKQTDRYLTAQIGVGLAGLILTMLVAHEGGELVHRHGIGVAIMERQKTIPSKLPAGERNALSDTSADTSAH